MAVVTQIQVRRGTAAQWTSTNPTLAAGEMGFETDTLRMKIGNGSTAWTSLSYVTYTATAAIATWLATPSSANLAAAVTDETGSGALVFGTSPTITTPTLTLSGTGSTTQAVIAWDQTNKQLDIGDGSTIRTITADNAAATLTNKTISGASNTLSNIGNSSLTNSSITINGSSVSLGGSVTIATQDFVPSFMLGGM